MATTRTPARRDPVGHATRRAVARQRIGAGARCACGESCVEKLVVGTNPIICHECQRRNRGQTPIDRHHLAGKANDPVTVPVPTNDHVAVLSEYQRDWPRETLENPAGCPLRRGAACIRGFIDFITYLIDRAVLWTADLLEQLSEHLAATLGERWWVGTSVEPFAAKR